MIEQDQFSNSGHHRNLRRPVVWAVTALCIGIVADHFSTLSLSVWVGLFLVSSLVALVSLPFQRWSFAASVATLLLLVAVGGGRNQFFHHHRRADNILRYVTEEPRTARMSGVIVSSLDLYESERGPRIPSWLEVDTSRFILKCERLQAGGDWESVSGRLSVDVNGHLVHARIGDRIELLGKLSRPQPVRNPGGYDFQAALSRQGIDGLFRVRHPQAVQVLEDSSSFWWLIPRYRETTRLRIKQLFVQNLSEETCRLALSLLLGDRTQLQDEMRDRFVDSGTMHLLAISGLHVGILAGLISIVCRVLEFSPRTTTTCLILTVVLYAMLTNHRPPVLRASMLITVICLGTAGNRRIEPYSALAFCAAILLLWNPGNLFDIGAQLSFLAVGAIVWSSRALEANPFQAQTLGVPVSEEWQWVGRLSPVVSYLYQGYVVTGAIWLGTLPLTVATFHLVTPIGFVLNALLIPYIGVVLGLGYFFLFCGLLIPPLTVLVGGLFDWSVQGLLWVVDWAHHVPLGHFYCGATPVWWLAVYYILIAWNWNLYGSRQLVNGRWKVLSVWVMIGFTLGLQTPQRDGLKYTVLSVGHGLATVLELPGGETIIYDCGTFGDGRRAERTVEQYLRLQNVSHVDAVMISHADHDHFSGLFKLFERFSIGTLIVTQQFLDFGQANVEEICKAAATHGIPIRIVSAGDEIEFQKTGNAVQFKVLHPSSSFHSKYDNANSMVLSLEYANRRMLLTGDLERDGVEALLEQSTEPFDLVMAPHHGSKFSSPQQFFNWANSSIVLISTGDASVVDRLQEQLGPDVRVFATQKSGALTVEIKQAQPLHVVPFLK
ncbi:DNA internalization-related competence protein ComEC/Rec2 [Thalassoglobus polymorphus]|uniref:DNA internalization-related competence protein ComEC/Rec2 n=1 Tax=Thalassoglobus polymorphus TaxID=2527994 RepID=UPI0018D229E2|nr:DNA internalization-related competence protein ComEC/Rec2 [Thalassoglobus polymorphus]